MRVSIVGAGYVGLVSGACLAEQGHEVVCIDSNPDRVNSITNGIAPFFEPGLNELLQDVAGTRLKATADFSRAVRETELTLVAVGTGEREVGWVAGLLTARDRTLAGIAAPAQGLTLVGVSYPSRFGLPAGGIT